MYRIGTAFPCGCALATDPSMSVHPPAAKGKSTSLTALVPALLYYTHEQDGAVCSLFLTGAWRRWRPFVFDSLCMCARCFLAARQLSREGSNGQDMRFLFLGVADVVLGHSLCLEWPEGLWVPWRPMASATHMQYATCAVPLCAWAEPPARTQAHASACYCHDDSLFATASHVSYAHAHMAASMLPCSCCIVSQPC